MRCILIASCCILAGCGGGGGGDSGASIAPPLGSRSLPGGAVRVDRAEPSGFVVTTTIPDVATLTALAGDDYASATPVVLSRTDAGWHGRSETGTRLLVRVTLADGSVLETAPGDVTIR